MITVEHVIASGWLSAIRGMRNPMNSWSKSDSAFEETSEVGSVPIIGVNDLNLMKRLINGGSEHRKFLRMIHVQMDVIAPLYWWKQFDTYKIGTTANSCSTMHKISAKEFELDDFSHEHISAGSEDVLEVIIHCLNGNRRKYLETKDKQYWWQMIQLLPSSYNQRRTIDMNYETVINIIKQRSNHKLDEWNAFIDELMKLPYMSELLSV